MDHFLRSLYWLYYNISSILCFCFRLQDMWDLSYPTKLAPSVLEGKLLTTELPRKSLLCFFYWYFFFFFVHKLPKCFLWWCWKDCICLSSSVPCSLTQRAGLFGPKWWVFMPSDWVWPMGTLSEDQRTGGEGIGYISPSLSSKLPQAGCAGGIYIPGLVLTFPDPLFRLK